MSYTDLNLNEKVKVIEGIRDQISIIAIAKTINRPAVDIRKFIQYEWIDVKILGGICSKEIIDELLEEWNDEEVAVEKVYLILRSRAPIIAYHEKSDKIQQIERMHDAGMTNSQIANHFGCSTVYIQTITHRYKMRKCVM